MKFHPQLFRKLQGIVTAVGSSCTLLSITDLGIWLLQNGTAFIVKEDGITGLDHNLGGLGATIALLGIGIYAMGGRSAHGAQRW
jgi:hypothetical protein